MRFLSVFIVLLAASLHLAAQKGKVEGKVTDSKSGNKISGVSISIDGDKAVAATNVDGSFILNLDAGKKYTIKLSSVGYRTKEIVEVEVSANQVTNIDIVLEAASKLENEVVVKSSSRKESANALIAYQKNTAVVAQVISAETIRRSPDKNTGEVLKRVPGASVQEGKYLVIRGLADRYNQSMLNGILLSSTEPDRKTFSFDILPSSMIDNIIINKAFIPELPGEWAGGLIQVNTKDVPSKDFFSLQIGTGFNTQTIGQDFYTYKGSNTDFLGFDNGARSTPAGIPTKSNFAQLNNEEKIAWGKQFKNIWAAEKTNSNITPLLNESLLMNGGFSKKIGSASKLAVIMAVNYSRSNKRTDFSNQVNTFENNVANLSFDYFNKKYSQDILAGALGNVTLQLGNNNKITFKNMLNVNTTNYATLRTGRDFDSRGENIKATELAFKANTFFNTQLSGDHNLKSYNAKLHWYGSFNILDQYIPDQRRIQYNQEDANDENSAYLLQIGASPTSQKLGSRYYGFLSDYIYTAGADLAKTFKIKGLSQTIKGGYFLQIKDRLFDSRPFSIYLPSDNRALTLLSADKVFAAENFGNGTDNKFSFNELSGDRYRYIANSILNAGFVQIDNQVSEKLRAVWGVRVEDFDQVIGSMRKADPRHVYSKVTDFLPGVNITYKINNKTNFRVSGSQTVIRPEFRELSTFQFYDFDLGATVAGYTKLVRTKVSNFDIRYEFYPRGGELFTAGVFYKYFRNPIESVFNPQSGGASTYNFINAEKANSFGVEIEFRKKLDFNPSFKNFTVQGNFSYIYNRVIDANSSTDRPMQGQSPYLINASVQYDIEKYGINTTLLFNQIGRRISYVGGSGQPPIWENPRPILDFQLAKKVLKGKGEVKLNVADILNTVAIYYHDPTNIGKYDGAKTPFAIKRKFGTNVGVSFGYNF